MPIRNAAESDFDSCVLIARRAWPEFKERESIFHLFCKFFSNTCFIFETGGETQGFLLRFLSQVDPLRPTSISSPSIPPRSARASRAAFTKRFSIASRTSARTRFA